MTHQTHARYGTLRILANQVKTEPAKPQCLLLKLISLCKIIATKSKLIPEALLSCVHLVVMRSLHKITPAFQAVPTIIESESAFLLFTLKYR